MNLFGWITKRGKFIQCGLYEHVEIIQDNSELRSCVSKENLSRLNELEDIRDTCQELGDNGEPPE